MGDALREAMEMLQGMDVERELKPLFAALIDRLRHARAKHPFFARDGEHALAVLRDEVDELKRAIQGEGRVREKDEALDCIAVLARFWLGDHLPEGKK